MREADAIEAQAKVQAQGMDGEEPYLFINILYLWATGDLHFFSGCYFLFLFFL